MCVCLFFVYIWHVHVSLELIPVEERPEIFHWLGYYSAVGQNFRRESRGGGDVWHCYQLEYPISNLEQQSRNQFYNHGTHGIYRKRLTTKHTNHTKKTIVNFLLRKNLTIDFVKNVQKKTRI